MESSGRLIVLGDVHGCDQALAAVLGLLQPRRDDALVFVGDLIDRGPATRQVLERVLDLSRQLSVTIVRGNHEEMLFEALRGGLLTETWHRHGGREMLESYGGELEALPEAHLDLLRSSVDFVETDDWIIAHAAPDPRIPMSRQSIPGLRWQRLNPRTRPHVSGKTILCGHTPQEQCRPHVHPGWIGLDTWVYDRGGCLTAFDVESGLIYQASEWESWTNVRPMLP